MDFDENQSFFAKVAAVTEGRCNSKFMDTLLKNLKKSESDQSHLGTSELLTRLINILAPRLHLQSGFKELSTTDPAFVREVLDCLKGKVEVLSVKYSNLELNFLTSNFRPAEQCGGWIRGLLFLRPRFSEKTTTF